MAAKKDPRARLMSLAQVADVLDRDRNTVSRWIKDGCPVVESADRRTGRQWVLDLAEVVRWLESRAADSVAERLAGADGEMSYDEAKRREKAAHAIRAEIELAEYRKDVARVSDMLDAVAQEYTAVRASLGALGTRLASRLAEARTNAEVQAILDEAVGEALEKLTHDRSQDQQPVIDGDDR